jgi:hypothetical protein
MIENENSVRDSEWRIHLYFDNIYLPPTTHRYDALRTHIVMVHGSSKATF